MWNVFDVAYGVAGLLISLFVWVAYGNTLAIFTGGLLILAYAAGRAAGSHR
jgi:hypothetical protein